MWEFMCEVLFFTCAFEFPHVKTRNIATDLHAASQHMCDVAHTTHYKKKQSAILAYWQWEVSEFTHV